MEFIPVVVETLGGWAPGASSTIRRIGEALGQRVNPSCLPQTTKHLFGRLGVALWRGISRCFQAKRRAVSAVGLVWLLKSTVQGLPQKAQRDPASGSLRPLSAFGRSAPEQLLGTGCRIPFTPPISLFSASTFGSTTSAPVLLLGLPPVIPSLPVATSTTVAPVSAGTFVAISTTSSSVCDSALTWIMKSLIPRHTTGVGERVLIGNGPHCILKVFPCSQVARYSKHLISNISYWCQAFDGCAG